MTNEKDSRVAGAEEDLIIIVDPDQQRAESLRLLLEFLGREAVVADAAPSWESIVPEGDRALVLVVALEMGEEAVQSVVRAVQERDPNAPVLAIRPQEAVEGDFTREVLGYIEQPFRYQNLNQMLQNAELYRQSRESRSRRRPVELFRSLVGSSRRVRQIRHLIEQVAPSDATVLILGESGTGKEVVARNIHYFSKRRDKPFVPINCGAIPPDLLESELFGHEKGAFTGAISARQGRFELAEGGTLFLDEIGDMPLPMQVKLLRVLQERTFERVGSSKTIRTDVRVVAATHRNLEELIAEGKFREDLYYRLNVFPIEMPPLRERVEDIPLLINELISRIEHEQRGSVRLTPAAVMALCQYKWPGNVRELANLVERLTILYPFGVVDVKDLPEKYCPEGQAGAQVYSELPAPPPLIPSVEPAESRLPRDGINLKEHLSNLEVSLIKQALQEADGVVAHAAKLLAMRRTTLVEKLRKYGLQRSAD